MSQPPTGPHQEPQSVRTEELRSNETGGLTSVDGDEPEPRAGWWRKVRECAPLVASMAFVAAVQVWMFYPLHKTTDIPRWDESNYMGWGEALAFAGERLPSLDASPLYSIMYLLLTLISGHTGAVFTMKYITAGAASAALCGFLSVSLGSCSIAIPLALTFTLAQNTAGALPYVYQMALFGVCCALVVARRRPLAGFALLLLCALLRLEYVFVLAAALVLTGVAYVIRRRDVRRHLFSLDRASKTVLVVVAATLIGVALCVQPAGWNLGGDRTWFAFKQHYAVEQVIQRRFRVGNPWLDYDVVINADFPGAKSLLGAISTNAPAFEKYLRLNLTRLGPAISALFDPAVVLNKASWIANGFAVSAFLLLPGWFLFGNGRWSWPRRMRERLQQLGWSSVILVSLPLAIAPTIFVQPKSSYSVALLPLLLWAIGMPFAAAREALRGSKLSWLRFTPAFSIGLIALVVFIGPRPFATKGARRGNLELIRAARRTLPNEHITMVGCHAGFYMNYLGRRRLTGIEGNPAAGGGPVPPGGLSVDWMLATYNPDAILINGELTGSPSFRRDSLAKLRSPEWHPIHLGGDDVVFLRRR